MMIFFHDPTIIDKLRAVKYEMILTDITNMLTNHLSSELNIAKKMYVNPTCVYTWYNDVFEYNPTYNPLIGTTYSEIMTLPQRFVNQLFLLGTRAMYVYFAYSQNQPFVQRGF